MNTGCNSKQTTCLCRDTGGKGTLPAQHTTFNTLDNWAINPPPNQKGKGLERKGYTVMARNMYTIHSVTHVKMVSFCEVLLIISLHVWGKGVFWGCGGRQWGKGICVIGELDKFSSSTSRLPNICLYWYSGSIYR